MQESTTNKPFLVAEIGINHNGDFQLAKRLLVSAAESGADSVKYQYYDVDDFVSPSSGNITYDSNSSSITESQYDLFRRCQLSFEQIKELKLISDKLSIDFHATPTNETQVYQLSELGCKYIKNGSDFLANTRLLKSMAVSGLIPVISTGMSSLSEIETAINTLTAFSTHTPFLLHCTSQYPAPPSEMNLRRITTLSSLFDVNIGLSDHSQDNLSSILAASLGAVWIEKHFTLDRTLPGPDHHFSITPEQLTNLKHELSLVHTLLGTSFFHSTLNESRSSSLYKLSLCYSRDLEPGSILDESDICLLRPGHGLPPNSINHIIGLTLTQSVQRSTLIQLSDFT